MSGSIVGCWIPLDGKTVMQTRIHVTASGEVQAADPTEPNTHHAITPCDTAPVAPGGIRLYELKLFVNDTQRWATSFVNRVQLPPCFGAPILYGPLVFMTVDGSSLDEKRFHDCWIRWLAQPRYRNMGAVLDAPATTTTTRCSPSRISPMARTMAHVRRSSREQQQQRQRRSQPPSSQGKTAQCSDDEEDVDEDEDDDARSEDDEDIVSSSDDDVEEDDEEDDDYEEEELAHSPPPAAAPRRRTRTRVRPSRSTE